MSAQMIRWAPVVATIRQHLDPAYTASSEFSVVRAFGRVPSPRPKRFVRVLRAGGQQVDLVTLEPLVIVESWGGTDEDAESLADFTHSVLLKAARDGFLGDVPMRRLGVASAPQRLPDPVSGQDRYSAMYAPQLRGSVA